MDAAASVVFPLLMSVEPRSDTEAGELAGSVSDVPRRTMCQLVGFNGATVEEAERSMLPAMRVADSTVMDAEPSTETTPLVSDPAWVFAAAKVSDPSAAPPVRSMVTVGLTAM